MLQHVVSIVVCMHRGFFHCWDFARGPRTFWKNSEALLVFQGLKSVHVQSFRGQDFLIYQFQGTLPIANWESFKHWPNIIIVVDSHTSVEPVKATLSMSMWLAMDAPAVGPNPGTMFTTPGGKPAWNVNPEGMLVLGVNSKRPLIWGQSHLNICLQGGFSITWHSWQFEYYKIWVFYISVFLLNNNDHACRSIEIPKLCPLSFFK